jgi:hypothetical protein
VSAELAVLQRLVFGRSSEQARPERRAVMATGTASGQVAAVRGDRGRGRDAGITRICLGSR